MHDLFFLVLQEGNQNPKVSMLRVMYLVRGQAVSLLCYVTMTAHTQDPSHARQNIHGDVGSWCIQPIFTRLVLTWKISGSQPRICWEFLPLGSGDEIIR